MTFHIKLRHGLASCLFWGVLAGVSVGETAKQSVHLKDGDVYSGKVIDADESYIQLETRHGRVRISWNDIQTQDQTSLKTIFLKNTDERPRKFLPMSKNVPKESLILPVIVKAKGIVGKQGQWDSYYDPDVFDFVQKASVEIELKNGTRTQLKNLRLIYFVFAIQSLSREQYVAGAGHLDFDLDKLASLTYRTDSLFFHGERTAFEYLPNYRAGDKYYGYVVTVWQGDELAGFYSNPRSLQKLKVSVKALKEEYLRNSAHPEMLN